MTNPRSAPQGETAGLTFAPWTSEQVVALNAWQERGDVHPFTCVTDSTPLEATTGGWTCPTCDYTQKWAHNFMAAPAQPEPLEGRTRMCAPPAAIHRRESESPK